jgi:hypothetical protein
MRAVVFLGATGLSVLALAAAADVAHACGGCFHGPSQDGDPITAHRMIFAVSPQQTTLYDEIEYSGSPQSFAWVLPIAGPVTVGLSADILFAAIDASTQTTIESPNLPACPSCGCFDAPGTAAGADASATFGGGGGSVNVISQQVVGPYDTVQLQSTDPNALTDWLTANGYSIPSNIDPIIAAYVQEGFDFLALKLQPGQGVQAMRPVRVTSPGAGVTLPLRMVAAGTGAKVGITLWVVADGRYEPTNFPTFIVQPSQLVWDWSAETSNYTTVQQAAEAAASYGTWQVESSLDLSPYVVESAVLQDQASTDYLAIPADDAGEAGAGETADQARTQDLATVFPGGETGSSVRITRLRADLSQAALATDLVLGASSDQSELSNRYQVTQSVNAPACPAVPNPCPPCGGGSSSSGGLGSSGDQTTHTAAPGQQSFSCSAVAPDTGGAGMELVLGGLLATSFVRARLKRRGKK